MEQPFKLKVLRVMSYKLLHFLIKENILHDFLSECVNSSYCIRCIKLIEDAKKNGIVIDFINLRTYSEIGQYFTFDTCITHDESFWWRKYFEYKDYYEQFQQSK